VRQCLVALSDSTEMLRRLMNYRFDGGGLCGYNFGNLFLSALEKINGSFTKGVMEAADILDVKGDVIPVSEGNMRLHIKLANGKVLVGENNLDHNQNIRKIGIKKVFLKPRVRANKKALKAIEQADFIIIGPGDHFGSIISNLLVDGITGAIKHSKAKVIYNVNLTNKKGQTDNWDLDRYVFEINGYIGENRVNFATHNSQKVSRYLATKYVRREGSSAIVVLKDKTKKRPFAVIGGNFLYEKSVPAVRGDADADTRSFIRHDSDRLARTTMFLIDPEMNRKFVKKIL